MLRHYLKSAWRNLLRQRMYTAINVMGLTLGISVFTTITIYVQDELSYDKFHPDHVYRVSGHIKANGQEYNEATCQFPLAEVLQQELAGIEHAVRVFRPYTVPLLRNQEIKYTEESLYYADESFFDVFGFQLATGDPQTALRDPSSIVLTEQAAIRYFGHTEVLGEFLEMKLGDEFRTLRVTGVLRNEQLPSHFHFDMLVPLEFLFGYWEEGEDPVTAHKQWFWTGSWTYVKLQDDSYAETIQSNLPGIVQRHFPEEWREKSVLNIEPVESIHLKSNKLSEMEPNGSSGQLKIFATIGLVVLLMAMVNFVNLMSAQGFSGSKQIGVRKHLGALRADIVQQTLTESILLTLVAGLLSLLLTQFVLLSAVDNLAGKELSLLSFFSLGYLTAYFLFLVFLGMLAGLYPALAISRLNALKILKGSIKLNSRGSLVRQSFVVTQFAASTFLIVAVIFINRQNTYTRSMDTGIDKENILVVKASNTINNRLETFKDEIGNIQGVAGISATLDIPGRSIASLRFVPQGRPIDQPEQLPLTYADEHFLDVLGLKLASGRFFDNQRATDFDDAFVINERAAALFGWSDDAVGKELKMYAPGSPEIGKVGRVIGVIHDYNFQSIHHQIKPLVITMDTNLDYYLIKYQDISMNALLSQIQKVWNRFDESWPMEAFLLDQNLAERYDQEQKLLWITRYGMAFALLIAVVGIYGLSSYLLSQRTKEVGVRRVLGSKQLEVMITLSRNFIGLIILANLIAIPLAYFSMRQWLANFVYHIELSAIPFLVGAILSLAFACLAIGYHVIRIAKINPIVSLRYE